jgi:predicted membrane-bound spermidine synthase
LALYLISTYIGSQIYRNWSRTHQQPMRPLLWVLIAICCLLAAVTADPQVHLSRLLRLILGIVPFSGLLGFVTPMLVDRWSGGDPDKAGTAYAWNVVGCIAGPLLSGFLLLPRISERWVLFVFSLPWLAMGCIPRWSLWPGVSRREVLRERLAAGAVAVLALLAVLTSKGYEGKFASAVVLRDNTATTIATGEGMGKRLFVNGVGMTYLTSITKMMAHLPLAFLSHPPENALAVCFGMGTSFRSLRSWNISTTAVELVPSVPKLFWYFHPDAPAVVNSPLSHIVIDDGRAYLERAPQQYDVITIDPPPPVEAAGSSLLYSQEFYATIRQRLRPGGILQQWMPKGDAVDRAASARALTESFPYVRVFGSLGGLQFLASSEPLPKRTASELAARLPEGAVRDLTEWGPEATAEANFARVLNQEQPLSRILAEAPTAPALADDRPLNEYYALRRYIQPGLRRGWTWARGRASSN